MPSSAAIQAPSTPTNGAALVFTVTADSITQIGYINGYFGTGTTISLTSTPAALVSVDASTGQIDLVAPAAVEKPLATKSADGSLTYVANFKALYDKDGKNLALTGASRVTVDPKSGKLISFR